MKNLDLTVFESITWDVTLPFGEVVRVKKPTQKMLIILEQKIKDVESESNTLKQIDKLTQLTQFILENNKGDIKIEAKMLDKLTADMLYAIYFGYMEFVSTINDNPN